MAGAAVGAGRRSPYDNTYGGRRLRTGTSTGPRPPRIRTTRPAGRLQLVWGGEARHRRRLRQLQQYHPAREQPSRLRYASGSPLPLLTSLPVTPTPPNPVYAQDTARRSPAPQANSYSHNNNGSYDNAGYDSRGGYSTESTRPLRAPPQRQYSRDVVTPRVDGEW